MIAFHYAFCDIYYYFAEGECKSCGKLAVVCVECCYSTQCTHLMTTVYAEVAIFKYFTCSLSMLHNVSIFAHAERKGQAGPGMYAAW